MCIRDRFKSIHLIAVISWMAGLLYLPRIFVYHSEASRDKKSEDLMSTFKVMERRLFIYIMNPAMIVSWIFGVLLIVIGIQFFSIGLLGELLARSTQGNENRIKKFHN